MTFEGKIIKDKSYDPYFKVTFTYKNDEVNIEKRYAEIHDSSIRLNVSVRR